jgi:uncharacterized protein (DUF362 family)
MDKPIVAVKRYESSPETSAELVALCSGLDALKGGVRVFIKPNLVAMDEHYPMPLYGVYTTTKLVRDMVTVLKDHGIGRITIGEGSVYGKGFGVPTHRIYEILGYTRMAEAYGLALVDMLEGPFDDVDFGGYSLEVSRHVLETDFLVNMPVLKTHNQSVVSLGLKNLKGCLSIKSRKHCHSQDQGLDQHLSMLVEKIKPDLTVLDGIYGLEKGPFYTGKAVRINALAASKDPLAADAAGAFLAGLDPKEIPHLRIYGDRHGRSLDEESFEFVGDPISERRRPLKWDNTWREDNSGPKAWDRMNIRGIRFPKYDKTLCTGCSGLYSPMLFMVMSAYEGKPFDEIEILTGKALEPSGSAGKTMLVGNCMIKANRDHPRLNEAILVKGCPPSVKSVEAAMTQCGIHSKKEIYEQFRSSLMARYDDKEDFDEGFYYL